LLLLGPGAGSLVVVDAGDGLLPARLSFPPVPVSSDQARRVVRVLEIVEGLAPPGRPVDSSRRGNVN
jgi:hypothetical protein